VDAGVTFAGDDRLVDDYLWFELLSRLPARQVSLLTRTAVLDRMCGPLCDAVLGASGSGRVLESLAESNLLLVPLDRRRDWYRYHHLFRDLLGAELQRREPKLVPQLHLRAAAWCEANGLQQVAIDHAEAAGDADRVARLVLEVMQPVWASGRVDAVLRWMEWLDNKQLVERYPAVAVHGALIFALLGRSGSAERWAAAAERASPHGRLADSSTVESYLAYLRAILWRADVDQMRRDARAGWDGLSPSSSYRATMLYTEGLSYLLAGDADRADPILARAYDAASEAGSPPLAAVVLAERCILAAAAATGGRRRRWPTGHWPSFGAGSSMPTGPARWCTRGQRGWRCTVATSAPLASTSPAPRACDRCSPTPSRSCRSRRC
jgi:LuxR family maltose regulon positive regulatory protein